MAKANELLCCLLAVGLWEPWSWGWCWCCRTVCGVCVLPTTKLAAWLPVSLLFSVSMHCFGLGLISDEYLHWISLQQWLLDLQTVVRSHHWRTPRVVYCRLTGTHTDTLRATRNETWPFQDWSSQEALLELYISSHAAQDCGNEWWRCVCMFLC